MLRNYIKLKEKLGFSDLFEHIKAIVLESTNYSKKMTG